MERKWFSSSPQNQQLRNTFSPILPQQILRTEGGYKQVEAARKLGVTKQYVSQLTRKLGINKQRLTDEDIAALTLYRQHPFKRAKRQGSTETRFLNVRFISQKLQESLGFTAKRVNALRRYALREEVINHSMSDEECVLAIIQLANSMTQEALRDATQTQHKKVI